MPNYGNQKPPLGIYPDSAWIRKWGCKLFYTFRGHGLKEYNLVDRSGLTDGTLTNMAFPASAVSGRVGKGLSFDGVNDYVDAGNGASLQIIDKVTVSVWFKIYAIGGWQMIAGRANASGRSYEIFTMNGTSALYFQIAPEKNVISGNLSLNVWHHAVLTYDHLFVRGYVDGVSVGTPVAYTGGIQNPAQSFRIGAWGDTYAYFNGLIDDVRIYNMALPESEINRQYRTPYYMFPRK